MNAHEAYARVARLIHWQAVRRVGHGPDADDLAQDAAVGFLENFHKFDGNEHHLCKFAWWEASAAHRRLRRTREKDAIIRSHGEAMVRDGKAVARDPDPFADEGTAEDVGRVRSLVSRLPGNMREALVGVYGLDGGNPRSAASLARECGTTARVVRHRLRAAVEQLRHQLIACEPPSTGRVESTVTPQAPTHPEDTAVSLLSRPKPRRETIPLERLVFDPLFQLRGETFNEDHVRRLVEVLEAGEHFDPLEVVEVAEGKLAPKPFVIDGFNRGEAYRRRGVSGVECLVYTGTRADAELWALSSNSKQPLARTPEDCRRAFDRLLDSPVLLDRVIQEGRRGGGTERSIARACGLSGSIVGKYLHSVGMRSDRLTGKLIPLGAESPERVARRELVQELTAQGKTAAAVARELGISHETATKDRAALAAAPPARAGGSNPPATTAKPPGRSGGKERRDERVEVIASGDTVKDAAEATIAEGKKHARALGRVVEDLLRSKYGNAVRAALRAHGHPTQVEDREEMRPMGVSGGEQSKLVKVESWPLVAAVLAALTDVQAQLYTGGE